MLNPLPDIGSRYGASMGRPNAIESASSEPFNLQRVRLDRGGYDSGGSYWGIGAPLYTYGNGADWNYLRAQDRADAKAQIRAKLGAAIRFLR